MKAQLILYKKGADELDNIIEVNLWQLPKPTADKPHKYKYSLVYIVNDMRVIGYDNAEGKGDIGIYGPRQSRIVLEVSGI